VRCPPWRSSVRAELPAFIRFLESPQKSRGSPAQQKRGRSATPLPPITASPPNWSRSAPLAPGGCRRPDAPVQCWRCRHGPSPRSARCRCRGPWPSARGGPSPPAERYARACGARTRGRTSCFGCLIEFTLDPFPEVRVGDFGQHGSQTLGHRAPCLGVPCALCATTGAAWRFASLKTGPCLLPINSPRLGFSHLPPL
jgi:hypothetical protein